MMVWGGLGVLVLLATVPWIVGVVRRKPIDLLEIIYPFSLLYFVEFGGRTLWLLLRPDAFMAQTPHPSVVQAAWGRALIIAAGGLAAYLGAYYMSGRWGRVQDRVSRSSPTPDAYAVVALVAFAIGVAARAPLLLRGWYMSFAAVAFAREVPPSVHSLAYLGAFGTVGYTLGLIAFFTASRPRWLGWMLWGVIMPVEAAIAFLTGSKFALLTIVLIPLVVAHYMRRPLRGRTLALVVVAFMLIAVPLINVYRGVVAPIGPEAFSSPSRLPLLLDRIVTRFLALSSEQYADATVGVAVSRFIGIDALASVIGGIPVLTPYLHGRSLLWAGKILLPTVLWPEKYDALADTLRPVPLFFGFSGFSRGGLSITYPGELYWNFGTLGVLAGMAFAGLAHRMLVAYFRRPGDTSRIAVYAMIWVWVVLSFEGWFYVTFSNVVRIVALAVGAVWLASKLSSGKVATQGVEGKAEAAP